jgi:L-rhamnose isomerase
MALAFERYVESAAKIYAGLPEDWKMFIEHKMYEPALYATVIQDWGTNYLAATSVGDRAFCRVDQLPNDCRRAPPPERGSNKPRCGFPELW